jgi:16S rRNA processing protein RimM
MHQSPQNAEPFLTVAHVVGVYGIKGWVRLRVQLDNADLLLTLSNLRLVGPRSAPKPVSIDAVQRHGKGFIACFSGLSDRTAAEKLKGFEVQVATVDFPAAASDEVYWRDLLGLKVWCTQDGSRYLLGEIKTLLETGANDVMVISPCTGSVDDKEHLIPWIPGDVVIDIDLDARNVEVNWYVDA